ncbi:MAG: helix-turn-helix domain-containing protein [Deltaproteobacteria bacterium]|nr:MAG: helix-turn-helix domain-containing protein [Deltaproteobacteria bacterium]
MIGQGPSHKSTDSSSQSESFGTGLCPPETPLTKIKVGRYERVNFQLFENPYWDVKKAAEKLSVSELTLRDWVYKRQIPFKKVGNLIRFDPSEIHCWIEGRSSKWPLKSSN